MWLEYTAAQARLRHSPKTARRRAFVLSGRRIAFAERTLVAAQWKWQLIRGRDLAFLLVGLASMMIAATGYTSIKEARTTRMNTKMQPIGHWKPGQDNI